MRKISLMGATGSIGMQTLDVIRENKEQFELTAISAGRNIAETRKIIQEFNPRLVSVQLKEDAEILKNEVPHGTKVLWGEEGLLETACHEDTDVLVNAVLGSVGLFPTLRAIEAGKTIAIANKETLVTAGHIVMEAAARNQVSLLPVDSEHSAIFQSLQGENTKNIESLIITASGGSFRDRTRTELEGVTVDEALNHPNWAMGAKITIDSATMMNKGLEVIEAHWLFGIPYENIKVLLHRESIIHSMVEFHDSSVMAQLGTPDMRVPIQYALTYPDRFARPRGGRLNLAEIGKLHFEEMDFERFRCLEYCFEAGKAGGSMPAVLNAANEAAVARFLNGDISFLDIETLIEKSLTRHELIKQPDLEAIREIDSETRRFVNELKLG
ncbi:1-deoxy-D-xylulose-5-phosphate reductoisomerase [Rossellomorea vietnamensis]|uniref:1-deoxy-D-xylulose 5-phosphate reductoisomerase n=1 Tax=Rossellomorea vietnamensis TaxID=218284 RepID=A0A5D4KMD0_9BACI|nr:1-deoxy-D-xylulose-5-phosphate reductoisomerase [Rossellomorea vietnamensis]TYR77493.1 1-deoxy-D-xylulose-5-phosphate reductoisomerase [Rossellomorea vietnamensis]